MSSCHAPHHPLRYKLKYGVNDYSERDFVRGPHYPPGYAPKGQTGRAEQNLANARHHTAKTLPPLKVHAVPGGVPGAPELEM